METLSLHPICASALHEWLAGTLDYANPDAAFVYFCTQPHSAWYAWAVNLVEILS